jgi:hypothetical protein
VRESLFLRLVVATACFALSGSTRAAHSHLPVQTVFRAFQFTDDQVPTIDGDLGDWAMVNESYVVTTGSFVDLIGGAETDEGDFSVELRMGWNKNENKLFFAAQVADDFHQIDRPAGTAGTLIWQDDNMSIYLDADHSGGQYGNFRNVTAEEQVRRTGSQAQWFTIAGPPPDENFFVNFSAAGWYALPEGSFTAASYSVNGVVGGRSVTNYELMLVPFDRVDMRAAFLSGEHLLAENEVIGINVEFWDFDTRGPNIAGARWSLSGGQNAHLLADRFTDLILMPLEDRFRPTSVSATSWGILKRSFLP